METQTVDIDTDELFYINALLESGEMDEEYEESFVLFVYRVGFTDGYEIDIRIVNDDPPYVEMALFLDDVEVHRLQLNPESLEDGEYVLCYDEREFEVLFD